MPFIGDVESLVKRYDRRFLGLSDQAVDANLARLKDVTTERTLAHVLPYGAPIGAINDIPIFIRSPLKQGLGRLAIKDAFIFGFIVKVKPSLVDPLPVLAMTKAITSNFWAKSCNNYFI
jgi:hypothetical protein